MAPYYQITFSGLSKVAFLLVNILLYKALPSSDVGLFAILYAIAFILATIFECGLRGLLVREIARVTQSPAQAQPLLTGALHSRLLTLPIYLTIGYLCARHFDHHSAPILIVSLLFATWLDSNANVLRGVLRAWNHTILDPALTCTFRLILLTGAAILHIQHQLTLPNFIQLFLAITLADLVTTFLLIPRLTGLHLHPIAPLHSTLQLIRRGSHFILLAILSTLYLRTGSLVLAQPGTPTALDAVAGLNLSARIPEGVTFLSLALMNAAIPYFARHTHQPHTILPHFRKLEIVLGSAAIIIAIGIITHAHTLIPLLATPHYLTYKPVFQLYAVTIFFTFLQYIYLNLLICLNKEKQAATRHAIILLLNLLLNILLVPRYGIHATIGALLFCEITATLIDLRYLHHTNIRPSLRVFKTWLIILVLSSLIALSSLQLPPLAGMILYWILGGTLGLNLLQKHKLTPTPNLPPLNPNQS